MLNEYPKITYNGNRMTDISRRFYIENIETRYSKPIYFNYIIHNWIAPENLAYNFYGSCDYEWVILSLNNIVDPFRDWLMPDEYMRQYIEKKYGNDQYKTHHYIVDGLLYKSIPKEDQLPNNGKLVHNIQKVSNFTYEMEQNEKKRKVKLLYPELISSIENEVRKLF